MLKSIGFVIVFGFFAFNLWWWGNEVWKYKQAENWPHTDGQITSCETEHHVNLSRSGRSTWDVSPTYRYSVKGKDYSGKRLFAFRSESDAAAKSSLYPVGKLVEVFYDPKTPDVSVIEPKNGEQTSFDRVIFGLIVVGVVCLVLYGSQLTNRKM